MKLVRRFLILAHRYLGVALSLLFVVWFATGIAMMYAREMPRLTAERRLEGLEPLDLARVRFTPAAAAAQAEVGRQPNEVTLVTVMGRPAYRLGGTTVFADTGEPLRGIDVAAAREVARWFMRLPEDRIAYVSTLTRPDQWTLDQGQPPLYKFGVDDLDRTQLYISGRSGEVAVLTTRGTRLMAWLGAIPHWLYFTSLRTNAPLWRQVVLWTSGLGIFLAAMGISLGLIQLRVTRPFQFSRVPSYIPYTGWMQWHYMSGVVFGVFTLTWVFSGFLSMEPWGWAADAPRVGGDLREAFTSSPGELSDFPAIRAASWAPLVGERAIKEIEYVRIQGEPFYVVRRAPDVSGENRRPGSQSYGANVRLDDPGRLLIAARTLQVHDRPFGAESLVARVEAAVPETPIVALELLTDYDSYYYSRGRVAPLPVLRVKLGDPESTWLYIDPLMSQLVWRAHRLDRLERWLYNGLHSLDFGFWYERRPLWDIGMIALVLGGLTTSVIGLFMGVKRLGRGAARVTRRLVLGPARSEVLIDEWKQNRL